MHRTILLFVTCAALGAGCTATETIEERPKEGQAIPKPSATIGEPRAISTGIWSVAIDVDVPTVGMKFVRVGDDPDVRTASLFLADYQHAFAQELQGALDALLKRNMHCTISALSVIHARELSLRGTDGGPMALPSGAIVILPCGGNEPLVKPEAPTPPMPH
jgi:hypothetical protein